MRLFALLLSVGILAAPLCSPGPVVPGGALAVADASPPWHEALGGDPRCEPEPIRHDPEPAREDQPAPRDALSEFSIDWDFLAACEGGRRLQGYVPVSSRNGCGVTIATGVDLGRRSLRDLAKLALDEKLTEKLKPYVLARGDEARSLLRAKPLVVTASEADALDRAVRASILKRLAASYRNAARTRGEQFTLSELPREVQTVIASVAFQYGPDLWRVAPNFWKWVTARDWGKAAAELDSFGDRFARRRGLEARLLERLVNCEDPPSAGFARTPFS
jgi:hypothetical protein